jgi:predicted PurR-regulated permease PerM
MPVNRTSRTRRNLIKVLVLGVGGGILFSEVVKLAIGKVGYLLLPIGMSLFFSFAMEPAVARLSRRMRRGLATFIVMLGSLLVIGGIALAGGAIILSEGKGLVENLPAIAETVEGRLRGIGINVDLASELQPGGAIDGIKKSMNARIKSLSGSALSGIGTLLPMLFMVFYFTADNRRLIRSACSLLPAERQQHVVRVWELAIEKAGGYLYSRIILSAISAAVHSVVFLALGVDYPIPMGIWVGVVSQVIPVVGTYLAGALPVLVALGESPGKAVGVVVAIIIYQQIENMVISPRITRNVIDIHPLAGFMSIIAGGALFGWVGALIAVPVCATVVAFASAFVPKHEVVISLDREAAKGETGPEENGAAAE